MDSREHLISTCDGLQKMTVETQFDLEISTLTIKKETVECIDVEESSANDYEYPYERLESAECINHYDSKEVLLQVGRQFPDEEYSQETGGGNSRVVVENKELSKVIDKQKIKREGTDERILSNIKTETEEKNYEITIKMEKSEEDEILDDIGDTNTHDMLRVPRQIQCNSSDRNCRKNFNSLEPSTEHIKVEMNTPGVNELNELYHCQYCNKYFNDYNNLLAHISDVHKKNKPECELCGKQFKNELNLERHILFLHRNKESPQQITPNNLKCKHCNEDFKHEDRLNEHMKLYHPGSEIEKIVYKCELCERFYKRKQTLTLHVKRIHQDYGKMFDCWCGEKFRSPIHLYKHKRKQHESEKNKIKSEYICTKCEVVFKVKQDLKDHMKRTHYKHIEKCKCWCGRQFTSKIKLSAHESLRHFSNNEQFQCDSCQRIFKRKANLVNHIKRFHYDYGRLFECFCGEHFTSPIFLKQHKRAQHDPTPDRIRCETCQKLFKSRSSLFLHIRRVHYDYGRLFECWCGKQFRSPLYLSQHKKLHDRKVQNTEPGKFQCDSCKKFFKRKPDLRIHIKKFHYDYGRFFECFCGEQFYSPMLLNLHKKRRHDTNDSNREKFQCTTCQKLFQSKLGLEGHIKRIHYDYGRQFECFCGKQYRSPIHLQEHQRLRHYRKVNKRNDEIYQCESCKKIFKSRRCLVVHIKRIHYDYGRTFECFCGKHFRTPMQLNIHKKKRHVPS